MTRTTVLIYVLPWVLETLLAVRFNEKLCHL